jgi:hypothetical protein
MGLRCTTRMHGQSTGSPSHSVRVPVRWVTWSPASWNPLTSTGSSTIFFTFTYDPEINFKVPRGEDDSFESCLVKMSKKELKEALLFMQKQLAEGQAQFSSSSDADIRDKLPQMILFAQERLTQLTRGSTS